MNLNDLILNPNFGTRYRNDGTFKKLVDSYLNKSGLLGKVQLRVGPDNRVMFDAGPAGQFTDLREAIMQSKSGIRTNKIFGAGVPTYANGPYDQSIAQAIRKRQPGAVVKVQTFDQNQRMLNNMQELFGTRNGELLGLQLPNQEQLRRLSVTIGDKEQTMSEILDILGWDAKADSSIFKRLGGVATADRMLFKTSETPFNVATFSPRKMFANNPDVRKAVHATAREVQANAPGRSMKGILSEIYESMSDGMNFVTQSFADSHIKDLEQRGLKELDAASKLKGAHVHSNDYQEYLAKSQRGQAMLDTAKQMRSDMKKGLSFNFRGIGGVNAQTGDRMGVLKGDAVVISNKQAQRIMEHGGVGGAVDTRSIGIIVPRLSDKRELRVNHGGISVTTLEAQGLPAAAETNTITMSAYQQFLNPNHFLERSMNTEINEAIEGIRSGTMPPALQKVIEDLKNWNPDPSEGLAIQQEAAEAKAFVKRLEAVVNNRIDYSSIDTMTQQMISALKKHHGRLRKSGGTVSFGGKEVPALGMRFPMAGSTSAHMLNLDIDRTMKGVKNQTGSELLNNTLYIDQKSGRFGLRGVDIYRQRAAFGGMDLDDRLYAVLRYDSSAKRLFALTYRDPTAMGEYNLFDADILHDRNIPSEIRHLWAEKKKLESQIITSDLRSSTVQRTRMARRDEVVNLLDKYFKGEQVNINTPKRGVVSLQQNFIEQLDFMKEFGDQDRLGRMYAPVGSKVTDASLERYRAGSIFRSMRTSKEMGMKSHSDFIRRGMLERTAEKSGQYPGTGFDFVGGTYSEYHQGTGYFHRSQAIQDALEHITPKSNEGISSEFVRKRMEQEVANGGVLGRWINSSTVVDEFIHSNLKGLDPRLASHLDELLKQHQFADIPRELIIDAVVKDGLSGVSEEAASGIVRNMDSLGKIMALLQNKAKELNINANIGLDPMVAQERLLNDQVAFNTLRESYTVAKGLPADTPGDELLNRIMLPENDPKAYMSHMFAAQTEQLEHIDRLAAEEKVSSASKMLENIGDVQFTSDEMARAESFLHKYQDQERYLHDFDNADHSEDDFLRMLQEGENLPAIGDLNQNSIQNLFEMGLFDEGEGNFVHGGEALDRQLLAIAKLSAESVIEDPEASSPMRALMTVANNPDEMSVANLFTEALRRRKSKVGQITNLSTVAELQDFVRSNPIDKLVPEDYHALVQRAMDFRGTATNHEPAFLNNLTRDALKGLKDTSAYTPSQMQDVSESAINFVRGGGERPELPSLTRSHNRPIMGQRRYAEREVADSTAEGVLRSRPLREKMERLDSKYIRKLIEEEPLARKGMIGLAAFAAVGIGYRLTRDRSPEDAAGPPLLPGGSNYEDMPHTPLPSIYSSAPAISDGSALYQVNVSDGNYDPFELQDRMQQITGGAFNTNVYNSRPTHSLNMTALQRINDIRKII